jgi:hypothetical protein
LLANSISVQSKQFVVCLGAMLHRRK